MKRKKAGTVPVLALALIVLMSAMPAGPVFAGQEDGYHDPLVNWVDSADRTGELDINAVVTSEIGSCEVCGRKTQFTIFRTPEYTKDGVSAADKDIMYSDGTKSDGKTEGIIREGTVYTGYHWTKSVCNECGSLNSNTSSDKYAYGRNVYTLYDCAEEFMKPLEEKRICTYESSTHHRITESSGSYCGFCYGTVKSESSRLEEHKFRKTVLAEPGHSRFAVTETCEDCGYSRTGYVAARSVAADYHGIADGKPHTISVNHLSDDEVGVTILYGKTADSCTLTEAPSYRKPGYYTVYYKIAYALDGTEMTENGAAYVDLRESSGKTDGDSSEGQVVCECGDPDCCCGENCDGTNCDSTCTTHEYVLLEKIEASCEKGGCSRYVCHGCGKIIEKDQTEALGHQWEVEVVREADCRTEGKILKICSRCGKASYEVTPRTEHKFAKRTVEATCTLPGYTLTECSVCGCKVINDITPALPHDYKPLKVEATCENGGHTLHRCEGCGSSFITDYTKALGHDFDKGKKITDPTCTGSGVTEYDCSRCGYRKIEGVDPSGHEPGDEATCTTPQLCIKCGAVISSALGHDYHSELIEPTETDMGYTLYTCSRCGDSYKTDFVPPLKKDSGKNEDPDAKTTDGNGRAVIGGYIIFLNETDSGNAIEGASVRLGENGEISIVLPDGRILNSSSRVTVTVLNKKTVKPVEGVYVTVADTEYDIYADTTGADGTVTVPGDDRDDHVLESHSVYMYGYPDSTFRADGNMTRAEASAVFARLLAERRGEDPGIAGGGSGYTYTDVASSKWYKGYISYLSAFGILNGESGGVFRPDESITRSELTAMAVRFYNVYSSQKAPSGSSFGGFRDVEQSSWASSYINEAYSRGWIQGYGDGTFRGQNAITRGEMITITNHLLNRVPDRSFIDANRSSIAHFSDLSRSHWAYYEIMEASNGHNSELSGSGEDWIIANPVRK
ncbi:MAG: S-layer homology domain-containing protein [Firmicutes bacterium]|nr:S-layer homology domain-containing protein [Bacillota bacterium]